MSQSILIQTSLKFSVKIIKLQQYITKQKRETIISKQIIRSATSIGANINEANYRVPTEYSKKYDKEEYLLEIYKKIGIQVLQEADDYYYSVILPDNISIVRDDYGYCIKDSNKETLIHYYDRGPFYDRTVKVDQINVTM